MSGFLVGGCSPGQENGVRRELAETTAPDFPLDLNSIPLSPELEPAIRAGLQAWAQKADDRVEFPELAVRDGLEPAIQRPAAREAASQELYRRWQAAPTNFLWVLTAVRYDYLLNRTHDLEQIIASSALADTSTATGAFAYALRNYGKGSRGRFYIRASQAADLTPLNRLLLLRKTAMVRSDQGHHLIAVRQLLDALPEVRRVGGPRLETRYWYSIAIYLQRADRLDDAVHATAMGLHLAEQTQNTGFQGILRKLLAGILVHRREYATALAQFEATKDFGQREDLPWVVMHASFLAADLFSRLGRPDLALIFDRANLDRNLAMNDSLNAPRNMSNIADDFMEMGVLDSTLAYQERATRWVESYRDESNLAGLFSRRAEYYCYIGEYDIADSLLTLVSHNSTTTGLAIDEAILLLRLINQGLEMSRLDLAYRSLQRLKHLRPVLFDERPEQNLLADFELATADVSIALGDFQPARQALDRAWQAIADGGGVKKEWHYRRSSGELAVLRGDLAAAGREFAAGLELATAAGDPGGMAEGRQLLGRILLLEGKTAAARELFTEQDQDVSFGGSFRTQLSNLRLQGWSWRLEGDPARARDVLQEALSLSTAFSPADVLAGIHLELGRALVDLGLRDQALIHFESGFENLDRVTGGPAAGELASILDDTRRRLTEAVIAWHLPSQLQHHTVAAIAHALEVANRMLLHTTMQGRERASDGLLVATRAPDSGCTGLFFLGVERSYLWVGHSGRWQVAMLPDRQHLEELVLPVLADLGRPSRKPDHEALAELGAVLLVPLMPEWPVGETLTIVADGFLNNVPFAALILPDPDRTLALERGAISTSPCLLATDREQPSGFSDSGALLAVGYDGLVGQDDRLRNAENEARLIAELWSAGPTDLLIGPQATWSEIARRLAGVSVLHVASHARVREGRASESFLVMASDDSDVPLTTRAIRDLSWAGELVFLSSCEAGRQHQSGRAMMGLAGAFLAAGTKAVLASSAEVDDEAGLYIARRFYEHWLSGQSRAAALRLAQLDMIRMQPQWSHPFYWSHYRIIGTM